jgi:hypothetical protein
MTSFRYLLFDFPFCEFVSPAL